MNLGTDVKITRVGNAVAAGTTDINSSVVDMSGYEGVLFMVLFGTITDTAVTSTKAQQGAQADLSDAADLAGTGVTVEDTADNQVAWLDIYRPRERYVRCVVDRGTANAVVDGIIAIQYGPMGKPTSHDSSTVLGGEVHASPDEGTA